MTTAIENKEKFVKFYKTNIKRDGADKLLDWLLKTDFFIAPASSKFHCAYEGGLCEHSINVYKRLVMLYENEKVINPDNVKDITYESLAICGLLHDLCKANFYKISQRNVKNEKTGSWEKVDFYTIEELFPFGHGEKSVFIISNYMKLTAAESLAINWHMGGFDDRVRGGNHSISQAYETYPLAVMTHSADFLASYLDEIRD